MTHGHSDTNRRFAIVLDNYQDAPADSQLHEIMQTGLSEIPDGINVIIISRIQPPIQMTRLQASNNLTMLQWDDLRLTEEESIGIARLRGGKKRLSQETLQAIHEQTQGWAAGLVLMLEDLKIESGNPDIGFHRRHWIPASAGMTSQMAEIPDAVFNYFAAEIFQRTDKEVQEFLLKTAFLPKITVSMARELTGLSEADDILSELNRKNYFTIKHSMPEPAYEYHPLFRAFLLKQENQRFTPAEVIQVQRKAGEILEGAGQFEEAIVLDSHAEDWASMARLLLSQAQGMIAEGRNKTLEEWIKQMPEAVVDEAPWLLYWLGVCRIPFNPANARKDFEKVFELFQAQQDKHGMLISLSSIMNCAVYEGGGFLFLDKWIRAAETIPLESMTSLPTDIKAQIVIGILHALLFRQPERPDIGVWVERTFQALESTTDVNLRIQGGLFLAVWFFWTGNFKKAAYVMNIFREAGGGQRGPQH